MALTGTLDFVMQHTVFYATMHLAGITCLFFWGKATIKWSVITVIFYPELLKIVE